MNLKQLNTLLKRAPSTHKGQKGHVLVIAGSTYFSGAALLAAVSSHRIGADLVTLAAPKEVCMAANCYSPDLITIKLPGTFLKQSHYSKIIKMLDKYDVIHIGNGIGRNPSTKKLIIKLLKNKRIQQKLKIIDADALKMVNILDLEHAIFTPHAAEFKALMKNSKLRTKKQLQKHLKDNIILLKGKEDKIISKDSTVTNKTGNPGMAKAGTGDVLSGLCSGILAQIHDKKDCLKQSAVAAAWLSGYLGDILKKKKKGYYYIASDLISEIKRIRK